ncbi:hypothetical protein TRIUR3_22198 [Triticum urartu]|uniref:MSP domain-containing protein n=1 Tax=Triticum urartu TaxID=4572 RepID=M7YJA6_TRIUA|nr:hypothetical protein TRIUR3_22198 [Triticum urartu]
MASASASPPANAHAPQALSKSTLLGGVGDLDAAVSLRLHALFLPVPRLLLKAFEVAGDGRIWLPVPISLLLISTTTSSVVSPLLVGLVVGLATPRTFELRKSNSGCIELVNKTDQRVAFKAPKEIPQDYQCKDKFLIQSVIVQEGVTHKDIVPEMRLLERLAR